MKKILLSMFMVGAICMMGSCSGEASKKGAETPAESAANVIDYGIGATQLKAKKKAENKLQQINQQQNKALEDALAE